MILVTGGGGMVANALKMLLPEAIYSRRQDCDLSRQQDCEQYFAELRPTIVVHLAARVGGIVSNVAHPYDYFYDNVMINTNVLNCCVKFGVDYLVSASSSCSYPDMCDRYPMTEDHMHDGPPESTNLYYAYAKRMMQVHADAARKQHNLLCCVLYASNLYGEHDDFSLKDSHVIPALMMKLESAKSHSNPVQIKGAPDRLRQFTLAEDFAKVIVQCIERKIVGDYNFGSTENVSIGDLVALLQRVTGCFNKVVFDHDLAGVYRKDIDSSRLLNILGPFEFTSLEDGLKRVYKWYMENICGNYAMKT